MERDLDFELRDFEELELELTDFEVGDFGDFEVLELDWLIEWTPQKKVQTPTGVTSSYLFGPGRIPPIRDVFSTFFQPADF